MSFVLQIVNGSLYSGQTALNMEKGRSFPAHGIGQNGKHLIETIGNVNLAEKDFKIKPLLESRFI